MGIPLRPARAALLAAALLALAGAGAAQTAGPGPATQDDPFTPLRNAVVTTGNCSGVLIADRVVLTAAHCLKRRHRQPRPDETTLATCDGLTDQAGFQGPVWEDPEAWHPARPGLRVAAGDARGRPRLLRQVTDYALPRCADLALLRLDLAFPYYVARPLPVLTAPPPDTDRAFGLARLRYAGWGVPGNGGEPATRRQTGRVNYWGHNRCFLIGLPPWRSQTDRILQGDSGSPLLWQPGTSDGEVVIGILWGSGTPDPDTCGPVIPRQPARHGSYTPTFRPAIPGTEATDIGAWLRTMVPGARHLPGDG